MCILLPRIQAVNVYFWVKITFEKSGPHTAAHCKNIRHRCNCCTDEQGQANYNIYVSDSTVKSNGNTDSAASLHLEKIIIKDSRLLYSDKSVPMLIQAEHLYYEGTGDLSKSIFDLSSHIQTDSLNFTINNQLKPPASCLKKYYRN
jgi:hypothetical protein